MSTIQEKIEAVADALQVCKRRLKELDAKTSRTKAEEYEREMTIHCIRAGERILDITKQNRI